jgi:predicted small lipoprotein YifL
MRRVGVRLSGLILLLALAGCGGRCGIFDKGFPLCGI